MKLNEKAHVVAKIADCDKYASLNPLFPAAFEFLKRKNLAQLPCGRYEIVPEKCWASIQEAELHQMIGAKVECHRKYIDIQSPISRSETIGLYEMSADDQRLPFDTEKDCVFLEAPMQSVTLRPGEFAIFFPTIGAHAPCCSDDAPGKIKKLVIKVLAEQ